MDRPTLVENLQPPLRLMGQEQQIRAVASMDADSAPAGDIANNWIAGHGLAALRVAHHEPVDALNAYALRPTHAIDEPLERARLRGVDVRVELRVNEL